MYWYILFLLPKHKTPIGILLNYQMEITSIEEMQKMFLIHLLVIINNTYVTIKMNSSEKNVFCKMSFNIIDAKSFWTCQ